jgi:hypothetical protein
MATQNFLAAAMAALWRPRRAATLRPHFCSGIGPKAFGVGRLDEERAQGAATMTLQSGSSFVVPALADTRIQAEVGDQFVTTY